MSDAHSACGAVGSARRRGDTALQAGKVRAAPCNATKVLTAYACAVMFSSWPFVYVRQNDLTFLRLRSKKHEIMVAPDKDYLLIIIQDPNNL